MALIRNNGTIDRSVTDSNKNITPVAVWVANGKQAQLWEKFIEDVQVDFSQPD